MVAVPRVEQQTRVQGLPAVQQSMNAPLEAFGGGASANAIPESINKFAGVAEKIALDEKNKADDIAVADAYAQAVSKRNERMYDPKTGAMNKRGKDSFGVLDEYGKLYGQDLDEIEKGLSNDDQRAFFRKIRARQEGDLTSNLRQHIFTESKKFDDDVTSSGLKVSQDDAIQNYQNPGKVQQSIEEQRALLISHAARNGLPAEWVKMKTDEAASKTNGAVIQRMLANGNDLQAKGYYDQVKGQFAGEEAAKIEGALRQGSVRGETQRQATSIMAKSGSLREALDEARKIQDPEVQDNTVRELKTRFSENEEIKRNQDEQKFQYAVLQVEGNKAMPDPMTMQGFSMKERQAIEQRYEQVRTGKPPQTDWDQYYNLKQLGSSSQGREEFLATNLMLYKPVLADSEFKELAGLQSDLRKNDAKAQKTLDGFRSDTDIVNTALNEAGIDPTPKPGTDDSKSVSLFRRKVDQQLASLQQEKGRKATNAELQGIVDNLMVNAITDKGWFYDTKKKAFEITPEDAGVTFNLKDIPISERSKIEQALSSRNIPVSDEKIVELYSRKQRGMNGK